MQRIPTILRHRIEDLRLKDLARSIGEFARERPVAFMGGAVLAGFALSRLLKKAGAPAKTGRGTQRPDL